jgi:gluconokinase
MEYVLGIDIGTGSVKAVAVDLEGNSFADCQEHY